VHTAQRYVRWIDPNQASLEMFTATNASEQFTSAASFRSESLNTQSTFSIQFFRSFDALKPMRSVGETPGLASSHFTICDSIRHIGRFDFFKSFYISATPSPSQLLTLSVSQMVH
jgi:hypothetical protein